MKLMELTALKMAMNSNSDSAREKAARDMGVDDEPKVVDMLLTLMKDKSPLVRRAAAESMGKTGSDRTYDALVNGLKDQHPGVRHDCAAAIGKLHLQKSASVLAALLVDKDPDLRHAAEEALISLGSWAVEPTAKIITPSNPDYARGSAIKVLAGTKAPAAVTPLIQLLQNQADNLPLIAQALHDLGWKPATPDEFVRYYLAVGHQDIILKVGSKALDSLIKQLNTKNKEIKLRVISTIGMLKDPSAIDKLMEHLESDDVDVRAAVITAVGNIGDPDTVVPIIFALSDEADEVVVAACEALLGFKDTSSIAALCKISESNNYVTKAAAMKALGVFDDSRAIGALVSGLQEKRHEVKKAAIDSLIEIGPKTYAYFAECLTDTEPHVRRTGVLALRQANAVGYGDNLASAVHDKEPSVRRDAIEALSALKYSDALPLINKAVGDEETDVQVAALEALGELGDASSLDILIDSSAVDLLHDPAVRSIYKILLRSIKEAKTEDLERITQIKVTTVLTKKNSLAGDVVRHEIDPSKINALALAELKSR